MKILGYSMDSSNALEVKDTFLLGKCKILACHKKSNTCLNVQEN